jgi:hypothetical protein
MHKLAEKIADCMKAKVEAKGIDNIEGQDLVELGMWTDIIKDLVCYDKDKKIIEAMDEEEDSEEAMKYIEMYEDYPRKGYRGQPRDSKGRYMSRRRMGYTEMMMPEMYDYSDMEYMRDMDKDYGKMYYTDGMNGSSRGGSSSGMSNGGSRGYSESRYDRARRGYEETKATHKDNSPESKQQKMKSLEEYMRELSDDVTSMLTDMSQEEKTMLKNKMNVLMQKIG